MQHDTLFTSSAVVVGAMRGPHTTPPVSRTRRDIYFALVLSFVEPRSQTLAKFGTERQGAAPFGLNHQMPHFHIAGINNATLSAMVSQQ